MIALDHHDGDGACCSCHATDALKTDLQSGLPICMTCSCVSTLNAFLEGIRRICMAFMEADPAVFTRWGL